MKTTTAVCDRTLFLCSLMLTYLFVIHSLVGLTLIRPISNILRNIILPYLEVESLALLGTRLKPLSLLRENVI